MELVADSRHMTNKRVIWHHANHARVVTTESTTGYERIDLGT